MKNALAAIAFVLAVPAYAQPAKTPKPAAPPPSVSGTLDRQLSIVESDLVRLVKAMPAEKFDFVPPGEGFKGVRSFKQQVGHLAAAMEMFSCTLLGEKPTITEEEEKNGPSRLKTKEDYVTFLEQAFAHGHKAAQSVTEKNQLEMVGNSFKGTKLGFANLLTWHTFDHYGQLVVYARFNGVVPPASQGSN
jgi:uncharacterized damage-inducible protein DinB